MTLPYIKETGGENPTGWQSKVLTPTNLVHATTLAGVDASEVTRQGRVPQCLWIGFPRTKDPADFTSSRGLSPLTRSWPSPCRNRPIVVLGLWLGAQKIVDPRQDKRDQPGCAIHLPTTQPKPRGFYPQGITPLLTARNAPGLNR